VIGLLAVLGVIVLAGGVLLPLARVSLAVAIWVQGVGVGIVGIAGAIAFFGDRVAGSGFRAGVHPGFGIDPTSGFFLIVIAVTAVPVLVYSVGYIPGVGSARIVASLGGAFLLALIGVVCARDALSFLACWELMTILPAACILIARPELEVRRAIVEYLAITHLGGTGVWIAVLVLAERGVWGGASLSAQGSGVVALVGIAALIGFGSKAGLVPLHMWLPRTHPVAPSHLSALMSGVMVKVALYGLIRIVFTWMDPAPTWLGIAVMVVGAVSAFGGILGALVQRELKRLLAYSTIENVGIVAIALGASIVLGAAGAHTWAAIAFAAALLHVLNHAVIKAVLFLSAGSIERATGEHRVDRLGGLLGRMPWTGAAFGVGILAIAGIPLLNGFTSEWLILESVIHAVGSSGHAAATVSALSLAVLAATIGLALLCFVKLGGLALLGRSRSEGARDAADVGPTMRAGVVALAGGCLVLGTFPGLVLAPLLRLRSAPMPSGMGVGLWLPGTGGLPTLGLLIVIGLATTLLVRARGRRTEPAPVWNCGRADEPALAWTSAGFSSSLLLSSRGVLPTERVLTRDAGGGVLTEVRYTQHVPNHFEAQLYQPLQRVALRLAHLARRLQSGSLQAYVAYFVAVLIVLLVFARLVGS
jgi:hydrogenase-4 component B